MNSPTLLGYVKDVKGTSVSIRLHGSQSSGMSFIDGQGYRIGQVGNFVRIPIGYLDLFGIISQVGAQAKPESVADSELDDFRWITLQLIGEGLKNGTFERGISQYPTIDDEVHLVSEADLSKIYGNIGQRNHIIRIGHIAGSESIDALLDINKLVTRHSAVVGTTGSGKSTTVAGLLNTLSNKENFPSARVVVLDLHGEYGRALKDRANIYSINSYTGGQTRPLYLPYWAMSFEELMEITLGDISESDKGQILEYVSVLKKNSIELAQADSPDNYNAFENENITVDSPISFSIHRLWLYLHRLIASTHSVAGTGQNFNGILEEFNIENTTEAFMLNPETNEPIETGNSIDIISPKYKPQQGGAIYLSGRNLNIRRPLEGLASKLKDPRFDFLFNPGPWKPDENGKTEKGLSDLMESWVGGDHPVSILDLSGVPSAILNNIIGVLLRILYDGLFWARNLPEGGRERPLLIVMEEAHAYLNESNKGFASSIVQRIVKEGRKYGIGAMIVSQRPSEVNPTILSQCGTFITLRLSNQTDRAQVKGAISDNLEGLTDMLPILRTGEAIILGEAVKLPMRTIIDVPPKERRPDSQDPVLCSKEKPEDSSVAGGWDIGIKYNEDYKKLVETWIKQNPIVANKFNQEEEE